MPFLYRSSFCSFVTIKAVEEADLEGAKLCCHILSDNSAQQSDNAMPMPQSYPLTSDVMCVIRDAACVLEKLK